MKVSILLLLLTTTFQLQGNSPAPEIAWEFDPAFGVREQGLELTGFNSMKMLPDGVLKLAVKWKKNDDGTKSHLRSCYEMFAPYDSRDLGVVEARLRAGLSQKIAGAGIAFRVRLRYHKGGWSEQQIPLKADGQFHVIRIDFSKFRHPENSKGFYLYLHPMINTGGAEGWASVELDYLRVRFSDAGAVRQICLNFDEKIVDLQMLLRSFKPYGITPKGAEAGLKRLRILRGTLASGTESRRYQTAMELDREFARWHSVLMLGRRLKELFDEIRMFESSLARREAETVRKEATAGLQNTLEQIGIQLSQGEFDAARAALDAAEQSRTALWNRLLSAENDGPVWQRGVDAYSTGLFGWECRTREGLVLSVGRERLGRGFFANRDGTKTGLSISPEGATFLNNTPEVLETSWTSSNWNYPARAENAKPVDWKIAVSRLAPGIQLTAGTRSIRLTVAAGRDYLPTRILVPCDGGVKLLTPKDFLKFRWHNMAENWLLLLCDNGLPAAPWLLTLQHRPKSVTVSGNALRFSFAERAGTIGIANLYGVRPLPPDWSKEWTVPPPEVIGQCRRLNAIMTAYPWRCTEFFAIDRRAGTVRIENRFAYRTAGNDWNYSGTQYAPLPPVLVNAASKGYPARLPKDQEEFDFGTIYGPLRAVPGNRVEYTLPLPNLSNELFVRTERYEEQQKKSRRWLLGLPDSLFYSSELRRISNYWTWYLNGFCLFTPDEKQIILRNMRSIIDRYYANIRNEPARLRMARHTHRHGVRTEPFTGRSYHAYGWVSKHGEQLNYHDITDFAGFQLIPTQLYASLSGDWTRIRKHWPQITDLYGSIPRRAEWATMAVGSTDRSLVHVIDMAPDSWLSSEAVAKLAEGIGDHRSGALALYIAARQAVPLCAALVKREWDMAYQNRWDWDTQLPETGYFDSNHINSTRWDDAQFSTSGIIGMIHSPALLRLYRDFCPEALRTFLARMTEAYPQWADWKYIRPGKKQGQNGPTAFYRQILLRDALGEPTGELEKLFRSGLFDDNEFSVWTRNVVGRSSIVGLSVSGCAILTGRDAPLRLSGWGRAELRDARFSFKTGTATIELNSPEPFTFELFSAINPGGITVNGADPAADAVRYDTAGKQLSIRLASGRSRVELHYPDWQPPRRETSIRPAAPIALTPEMKRCSTERALYLAARGGSSQKKFVCEKTTPIRLTGCSNADSGFAAGDKVLHGVPMQLSTGAVGVGAGDASTLPKRVEIAAGGRWKRLYFLHTSEENGTPGEVLLRYHIHYADGSSAVFEARSGLELAGRRNQRELPNGRMVRNGARNNAFLSVWENTARDEIPGVAAAFQREYKIIDRISVEFAAGKGTAFLLAVTGEAAESEQ